ncbi:unnamed protein product [Parnassius apollo]|uniref:(apollo) hypothetical protein n=1 Tax=Parnassius apollo TaxID=110799 RepID=A0A8S3WFI4_PARAO|nr:unnamed protein product [Parnassius apollo]
MGDVMLRCPLCCKETFNSKHKLTEHLANVLSNLVCPICDDKWSTLVHLIEHLSLDNCQQVKPNQAFTSKDDTDTKILQNKQHLNSEQTNDCIIQNEDLEAQIPKSTVKLQESEHDSQQNQMYVELLDEELLKPCLQTQELKVVKESADRYVIVTNEDSILNNHNNIVTKQNNDGTISMTVTEPKLEVEGSTNSNENESEENQEVYSCNTCGVSFSSVLDHIQNYHNDQDVVVEEPIEDSTNDAALEYETVDSDDLAISDKQTPKRMITDTGDIVEAPILLETSTAIPQQSLEQVEVKTIVIPIKEDAEKQDKSAPTQRFVQIDKFCDSIVKDIKASDDRNSQYHKVIMKEMQTTMGNKIKVYTCVSCNVYVTSLSDFKSHPCKTMKYPCPHCPAAYENSKSLCAHMKVHKSKPDLHFDAVVSFECEICCTIFRTSKSLKLHKRMHDPVKSRPIEPPVETIEGNAASEDKYICPICFKLIPEDYRNIHENSHNNSNKMNCDICNKKFHSKEYLKMHMSVHNMDKVVIGKQDKSLPYTCSYCNRKFARPHEKVKHERIHTGEKPHTCEICGKAFRVSYCLTLHMRTHTGARPYACSHCGKRFKAHSVYNHHLLTHSEVRAYKCPYCPKAFKTSVQLAGHKNSHTKPFSCQQCNRPFASLYAVRVHTEIHSRQNSLKFSCSLCGASYARAFALKDHIKQAHKDATEESLADFKDEEWNSRDDNAEEAEMTALDKDLPHVITTMETNSNEMIIP